MRISIIICTHDRSEDLSRTLESLEQVRVSHGSLVDLVVVENGAKGNAESAVASFHHDRIRAQYLHESKKGKSRALNLAIKVACGDVLVFADDDVRFAPDWLKALCQPILDGTAMAAVGRIVVPPHLLRPWMERYHLGWIGAIPFKDPAKPDEAAGGNWACHRKAIEQLSGFDLELGGGGLGNCEDTLFSRQIITAGFSIAGAPDAEVEHHFQPAKLLYGNWVRAAQAAGRSRAYLLYHWLHEDIPSAVARGWYFQAKLVIRRALGPRRQAADEGIPAWELSYLQDLAKCQQFLLERRRPRNYARKGLIKLHGERSS